MNSDTLIKKALQFGQTPPSTQLVVLNMASQWRRFQVTVWYSRLYTLSYIRVSLDRERERDRNKLKQNMFDMQVSLGRSHCCFDPSITD